MKKIMFIGPIGVGKTTLTQRIQGAEITYAKTQTVQFHDDIIDTPGEFVQHRLMYNALLVTSAEADILGFLISAKEKEQMFPPGFASLFNKPAIGIITKMDLVDESDNIAYIEEQLQMTGASPIFKIGVNEDSGIKSLLEYLDRLK
ncbi:EutP/PduV family microcompartment system protein [Veillonella sp.]|uniref:EutP/PduV family microcompartment system protein n=1 Tax=Veillonella sp. TaxID=1926307 RepID=UPI0025E41E28|nr:EutP/PduV family microcompartment system protein [Veillonella sp.]